MTPYVVAQVNSYTRLVRTKPMHFALERRSLDLVGADRWIAEREVTTGREGHHLPAPTEWDMREVLEKLSKLLRRRRRRRSRTAMTPRERRTLRKQLKELRKGGLWPDEGRP